MDLTFYRDHRQLLCSKGVYGCHNFASFKKLFTDKGVDPADCIINIKVHPSVKGVYELKYQRPVMTKELTVISNQYKQIKTTKTVYDPTVISDEQVYAWGMEALDTGIIDKNKIYGCASNGLKFIGYLDLEKQTIKNFHPIF